MTSAERSVLTISDAELLALVKNEKLERPASKSAYGKDIPASFTRYIKAIVSRGVWSDPSNVKDTRVFTIFVSVVTSDRSRILTYLPPGQEAFSVGFMGPLFKRTPIGNSLIQEDPVRSRLRRADTDVLIRLLRVNPLRPPSSKKEEEVATQGSEPEAAPVLCGTICLHETEQDRARLGLHYVWTLPESSSPEELLKALEPDPESITQLSWSFLAALPKTLDPWSRLVCDRLSP